MLRLTDKARPAAGSVPGTVTVMQWAAVVTFDATNWHQLVEIRVVADPWFDLQPGRENLKSFAKRAHLLSGLRGPLAVEGGTTAVDRSLRPAVLLPGEGNGPFFGIAAAAAGVPAGRHAQRLRRLEPGGPRRHAERDRRCRA